MLCEVLRIGTSRLARRARPMGRRPRCRRGLLVLRVALTIEQDRLDGPPERETALDDDLRWAADAVTSPPETEPGRSFADRWPSADSAWSYGESPRKALIRERVLDYLDVHGRDVSLPHPGASEHRPVVQGVRRRDTERNRTTRVRSPSIDADVNHSSATS